MKNKRLLELDVEHPHANCEIIIIIIIIMTGAYIALNRDHQSALQVNLVEIACKKISLK